jgi:hypothetical protein
LNVCYASVSLRARKPRVADRDRRRIAERCLLAAVDPYDRAGHVAVGRQCVDVSRLADVRAFRARDLAGKRGNVRHNEATSIA